MRIILTFLFIILAYNRLAYTLSSTNLGYEVKVKYISFENEDIPFNPDDPNSEVPALDENHRLSYMFDNNIKTAFAVKDTELYIYIIFEKPILIDEIRIFNGWGKSKESFYHNYRIKELGVSLFNQDEYARAKNYLDFGILFNDEFKFTNIYITNITNEIVPRRNLRLMFIEVYSSGVIHRKTCISEIQLYYKGKRYKIVNLDEVEDKIRYGSPITQGHWIGEPIKYKEKPRKKWYEFWKIGRDYIVEDSKFLRSIWKIWWAIREIFPYLLIQLACFVFAIKERKEKLPDFAKALSIVSPLLSFLLIISHRVFYDSYIGNFLVEGFITLGVLLIQVIVGITLIIIVIRKRREIRIFSIIGYIIYGILLPLSTVLLSMVLIVSGL
ncbi:NADase-type glycan-binding domain-containing protein [Thermospira aquatica]|uniref:NAD glycohydrolase translocation F5/8 type C domain-containing protein n=1 Tax=Thermospira aquatica TaxID=2828656 RepID=A0AAX3BAY8_9SPIR|nr:hypothetical protein [Thermospira aquatica]URA09415.1 hypothetical protein KDW03_07925 [Thermospira aquatica]